MLDEIPVQRRDKPLSMHAQERVNDIIGTFIVSC